MKRYLLSAMLVSFLILSACSESSERLMIGGFTRQGQEQGFFIFNFNSQDGSLSPVSQADVGPNPSYFCYSAANRLLYVANEITTYREQPGGSLTTFRYFPDGRLEKIGEMAIPYGGTCFISMSPDSTYLLLANYPKGSVEVVRLGENGIPDVITDTILYETDSMKVSHAHMILGEPSGKRIFVSDLGLDRLMIYDLDAEKGRLVPVDTVMVEKGAGPRHFTFSKSGDYLYLINELGSKMMVFRVEDNKRPELIQTLPTFSEGFRGKNYCADVHTGKDGKYLYGSNRGENSIVTFAIQEDGTLKTAGHIQCGGNWPRNFVIDPSGKFLLVGNERSDTVAVFRINERTGLPSGPVKKVMVPAPGCLKFY